ncbi:hypothetical protein BDF20DRAFT_933015 [Mycotypha africana]|uniref:uncharacterized protein n=1 Tax=Mycotypha africana TaxID=64632 RepID=UPI002301E6C5|nr:uncharacterized protein BDF20DRAFT_933015 [Mycotypha africana]KAI8966993.1 hypothetical protein BDF20DRAFT_933015 [Mycotypha africana]
MFLFLFLLSFVSTLAPLFEDIENDVMFRWTSVSDDEKILSPRPDASINIVNGASLGQRVGCGEVKPQYQALNHKAVAKDLIRVGHLLKDASDKSKKKNDIWVCGCSFYTLFRTQEHLYTMCEIEHVQLPVILADIPLFLAQADKIMTIAVSFTQAARPEQHNYANNPPTLTDHELLAIIDRRTSRKRRSITSHYAH